MPFLILLIISLVGAIGLACAIQYFLRPGPWAALGYAFLAVAIFMIFAASGLWENANKQAWGPLTVVFGLMVAGGLVSLVFGKRLWHRWQKRNF